MKTLCIISTVMIFLIYMASMVAAQETDSPKYEIVSNIPYPNDGADHAQEQCKLDLYLPKGQKGFPVLIWFHGGFLRMGRSKSTNPHAAQRFAAEGFGVVLPNWQYPYATYPEYIEDAASVLAWTYQNITGYRGNPEKLFVGGDSAGAYLAAMVIMDTRYFELHQISGVISLSGEMLGHSSIWVKRGIYPKIVDETTPMFYVRRDVPPFLCLCAERERLNECEEGRQFIEALRATGHGNATFAVIPGREECSLEQMTDPDDPVVKRMLGFMQNILAERAETKQLNSKACWERKELGVVCTEELTRMELVWIPGGCFQMGCVSGIDCDKDELPAHEVCVDGFWMGKYEVTQQQWQRITGKNPSYFAEFSGFQIKRTDQDTSQNPVEQVSWNDVQEFIRKLNEKESTNAYRLPTEAEWEYAARAGTQTAYSFGNDGERLGEYTWYSSNSGDFGSRPVGQLKPNAWGLYDMHGNVGEWCQDLYDRKYYANSPKKNPLGPSSGFEVVSRGGVWHHDAQASRSANRDNISDSVIRIYGPKTPKGERGFRIVRPPGKAEAK